MVGIFSGVIGVECCVVCEVGMVGVCEVYLIDELVVVVIGVGFLVIEFVGMMIVDIGGGIIEVVVLSFGGMVLSEFVCVVGDEISDFISVYLKKVYNMVVGECMVEEIKICIGFVFLDDEFD